MRNTYFLLIFLGLVTPLTWYAVNNEKKEERLYRFDNTERYICPVHPEYLSHIPGTCPICDVKLIPLTKSETDTV